MFLFILKPLGLPHAHILIILHPEDVPKTADQIDAIVSAELPNPHTHPRLFKIVAGEVSSSS